MQVVVVDTVGPMLQVACSWFYSRNSVAQNKNTFLVSLTKWMCISSNSLATTATAEYQLLKRVKTPKEVLREFEKKKKTEEFEAQNILRCIYGYRLSIGWHVDK